jgi:hypothetical protein
MQSVRDFSGYFSKYLGKDAGAGSLSGRWWGSFNKQKLPIASCSIASLSLAAAVRVQRIARKWRQVKMNEAKSRADCRRVSREFGEPFQVFSPHDLWRLRSGYAPDFSGNWSRNPRWASFLFRSYRQQVRAWAGVSPGSASISPMPTTAPVVQCCNAAPAFALSVLRWVEKTSGDSFELREISRVFDLKVDRRKPVPPGRQFSMNLGPLEARLPMSRPASSRRVCGVNERDGIPKWERPSI